MIVKDKAFVTDLLNRLKILDVKTTEAYYAMGQILHAIIQGRLFEIINYASFKAMADEELSFTDTTARKYANTYASFQRLKYSKVQALKLLRKFGYTHLSQVLPAMTISVGDRAVGNRIANFLEEHQQINFTVTRAEHEECITALKRLGATEASSGKGRLLDSSQALMSMVRNVNATSKQAA